MSLHTVKLSAGVRDLVEVVLSCLGAPLPLFIDWCNRLGIAPGHRVERAQMEARVAHELKEFQGQRNSTVLKGKRNSVVLEELPVAVGSEERQSSMGGDALDDLEGEDGILQMLLSNTNVNTSVQNVDLDSPYAKETTN